MMTNGQSDPNMNRQKIAIYLPIDGTRGGGEKVSRDIIRVLHESKKYHITIFTPYTKQETYPPDIALKHFLPAWIKKYKIIKPKIVWWAFLYIRYRFQRLKNYDLIIQPNETSLPHQSIPILIYSHDGHHYHEQIRQRIKNSKGIRHYMRKKIYGGFVGDFDNMCSNENIHVITNSTDTQKRLNPKQTIVIPPAIYLNKYKQMSKKDGIVSLARYDRAKNWELLIKVMGDIGVKSICLGSTDYEGSLQYYDELKAAASENVTLKHNVDFDTIVNDLAESKVYLHAASREGFGITVIEAMASGCMPIVPDNTALADTVPFAELRYETNSADDAANKIRHALAGEYDHYLPKLCEHIKQYDFDNFQKQILAKIDGILKKDSNT